MLLLYGDNIPPHKHINKIADKYIRYFLKDREIEGFTEDEYVEIRIEERFLGLHSRQSHYPPIVPVKKEYLSKFINIFKSFTCNVCICNTNHEHPIASINGIDYEGFCYYLKDEESKILFLEEYGIEDKGVNLFNLDDMLEKNAAFTIDDFVMHNYSVNNKCHSMDQHDWYRTVSPENRYKIVAANTDTELALEQWLNEVL